MSRDTEIAAVKDALAQIPADVATVHTSCDEHEYRIDVVPTTESRCSLWFGFSTYETYGLCFGHGLCFEDIELADFRPLDVTNAVLRGRVQERVWWRGNKIVKSEGKIILEDARELADTAYLSWWPLGPYGTAEEIYYEPYIMQPRLRT